MRGARLLRKAVAAGCLAAVVSLLAVPAGMAALPTWTRIASNGVTSANNRVLLPGVLINGKLTAGAGSVFGGARATMYTYDSAFHQLGLAGFNSDNTRLMPWARYGNQAYIGTENTTSGGELYRWSGSGSPVLVGNNGWGLGNTYSQVNPVAVYQGKLLVCVGRQAGGAAFPGLRIYQYDGNTWTQVIGQGAAGSPTGPGFGNTENENITATEYSELNGNLTFCVSNSNDGPQIYSYNGSSFTRIGQAGAGSWPATLQTGQVAVSQIDNRLYFGVGTYFGGTTGELWSYDGSHWSKMALSGGIADAGNFFFQPFVRGADLYVAAWNSSSGCRVYKRQGNSFTAFSEYGFSNVNNVAALLATYDGKMFGETANFATGAEVYTTPMAPSIDRLVPDSGPYGTVVTIEGHDFGVTQGNSAVTIRGVQARVLSWSDLAIEAVFPDEATTGPVQVMTARGNSNQVTFSLTLSKTWHFAEGTTRDNAADGKYEEWICLQNPGAQDANVTLNYMLTDGMNQEQKVTVKKQSRSTVSVNSFLGPDKDVSTLVTSDQLILAERPMYFNYKGKWNGGHDAIGVPIPRRTYYFAEGTTRGNPNDGYFDEWLCLQNPGDADTMVTVDYLLGTGQTVSKSFQIKKKSRYTIDVNAEVGANQDVSCVVSSAAPVVAERPMYFDYHGKWTGGHDVVGAPGPDTTFYFAEGTTRDNTLDGSFNEWICLQNATDTDTTATITYYTSQAGTQTQTAAVPRKSRVTVDVNTRLGPDVDNSFKVTSADNVPILAERPMYFNYHSAWNGGHDVMGCDAPRKNFYFAEGTTRADFATWLAVMNPTSSEANVTFHYMLGDGTGRAVTVAVAPGKRYTRDVLADVGANQDVSIWIGSDRDVVAERPMYFNYHGWATGGHDTLGYGI
jgi:hypothetical protein